MAKLALICIDLLIGKDIQSANSGMRFLMGFMQTMNTLFWLTLANLWTLIASLEGLI